MARGVINALYHNAFNFLSSCDGKYAFDKWEDNMIEETKHCVADNILLAESILGRVDYYYGRASSYNLSTVSGFVSAKHGGVFKDLPSCWKDSHKELVLKVGKKYHIRFLEQEKEQMRQQERAHAQKLKEREEKAEKKILRESLAQVSYFTIPTLRAIIRPKQLEEALGTLRSMTQRVDFLKLFISMYGIGFGIDIPMQFSSTKNKAIGKYDDLLARANSILTAKHTIPDRPPPRKAKQGSSPADFGLTLLDEYKECLYACDAKVSDQVDEVLELDKMYGIKLLYDWDSIQRQYWDVPLSDLQKEFKRGRTFCDDGENFKVLGLSWDTTRNEYAAYYHEDSASASSPTRVNDPDDHVIHSFFVSSSSYDGIDSWNFFWTS
jgi:hypothetical protein